MAEIDSINAKKSEEVPDIRTSSAVPSSKFNTNDDHNQGYVVENLDCEFHSAPFQ